MQHHRNVEKKSGRSHDIVPICDLHHRIYEEKFAITLKKQLEDERSIVRKTVTLNRIRSIRAYNFSRIMLDEERIKKIPREKVEFFLKEMREVFGTEDPYEVQQIDLHKRIRDENEEVGKKIVESLTDIEEFEMMWRKHFVESMDPKFMPSNWKIDFRS